MVLTRTQFWLILGAFPLLFVVAHDAVQGWRETRPDRNNEREIRDLVGGVPRWRRWRNPLAPKPNRKGSAMSNSPSDAPWAIKIAAYTLAASFMLCLALILISGTIRIVTSLLP